ncbi:MAG: hypothetical protein RBQ94_00595 [Methanimicrococcus sp.]|nr:hypothetical protein [Methanimicrococcus sp.]
MKRDVFVKRDKKRNPEQNEIALDAIETVLEDLRNEDSFDFLIVVEGRRDIASLQNLGICTAILPCANQPLAEFCEKIAEMNKTVIILTDWDKKGGILASKLAAQFKNLDVPCNTEFREKLLFYSKREIKDVESLHTYVTKLRESDKRF